jgi:hypothetical protein
MELTYLLSYQMFAQTQKFEKLQANEGFATVDF